MALFAPHLDLSKRSLIVGAMAGVVLELDLIAAWLFSRWMPQLGLAPNVHRTVELLPFALVGGVAFLTGLGAFGLALLLALRPPAARRPRKAAGRRGLTPLRGR